MQTVGCSVNRHVISTGTFQALALDKLCAASDSAMLPSHACSVDKACRLQLNDAVLVAHEKIETGHVRLSHRRFTEDCPIRCQRLCVRVLVIILANQRSRLKARFLRDAQAGETPRNVELAKETLVHNFRSTIPRGVYRSWLNIHLPFWFVRMVEWCSAWILTSSWVRYGCHLGLLSTARSIRILTK